MKKLYAIPLIILLLLGWCLALGATLDEAPQDYSNMNVEIGPNDPAINGYTQLQLATEEMQWDRSRLEFETEKNEAEQIRHREAVGAAVALCKDTYSAWKFKCTLIQFLLVDRRIIYDSMEYQQSRLANSSFDIAYHSNSRFSHRATLISLLMLGGMFVLLHIISCFRPLPVTISCIPLHKQLTAHRARSLPAG